MTTFFEDNEGRVHRGSTMAVRVDANTRIGTGHVMRCLALAQAWQDAGNAAVFISAELPESLEQRLRAEGFSVLRIDARPGSLRDCRETSAAAAEAGAEWLVIDGFQFDASFVAACRSASILLLDDHASREAYHADIVLNPNIFAAPRMYSGRCAAELLVGPSYALLRRDFRITAPSTRAASGSGGKLLITMGGSDPDNVSQRILQAINESEISVANVTVLCGSANPHTERLLRAARHSRYSVDVLTGVSDMPSLLCSIDSAISAPGGTALELACLGIPMLLVTIASNHERTASEFAASDLAVSAGWFDQLTVKELGHIIRVFMNDTELRRRLALNSSRIVDARGAERVVAAILTRKVAAAI